MSAARPLEPWRWLFLPLGWCALATILFGVPLHVFQWQLPEPVFPMVLAFAWAVIRPSVLPPFAVLALGLFLDAFWGGLQGLWPISLLAAYSAALAVRRLIMGQDFLVTWAWYGGATAAAFGVGLLVLTLKADAMPSLAPLAWQFLASLALYPFADRLIRRYEDADVRFR